jgi:hypothetical protein
MLRDKLGSNSNIKTQKAKGTIDGNVQIQDNPTPEAKADSVKMDTVKMDTVAVPSNLVLDDLHLPNPYADVDFGQMSNIGIYNRLRSNPDLNFNGRDTLYFPDTDIIQMRISRPDTLFINNAYGNPVDTLYL